MSVYPGVHFSRGQTPLFVMVKAGRPTVDQSQLPVGWIVKVSTAAGGNVRKKYVHMLSGKTAVSLPDVLDKNKLLLSADRGPRVMLKLQGLPRLSVGDKSLRMLTKAALQLASGALAAGDSVFQPAVSAVRSPRTAAGSVALPIAVASGTGVPAVDDGWRSCVMAEPIIKSSVVVSSIIDGRRGRANVAEAEAEPPPPELLMPPPGLPVPSSGLLMLTYQPAPIIVSVLPLHAEHMATFKLMFDEYVAWKIHRSTEYFVTTAFGHTRSKTVARLLSNYDRCLNDYNEPLLTLCSTMMPPPSTLRFQFFFPPCEVPFVFKSLYGGMTLHIAATPSDHLIRKFIDYTLQLPKELTLYPSNTFDDWFKMFKAPTFFIYIEKDGHVLSLMSLGKMVSTKGEVILNILTTQANNMAAWQLLGKERLRKGLGDVMFTEVRALSDLHSVDLLICVFVCAGANEDLRVHRRCLHLRRVCKDWPRQARVGLAPRARNQQKQLHLLTARYGWQIR